MKTEKLFQLLTLVNGITCKRWDTVMQLVDYISLGKAEVKEKEWHDTWKKKYYELDLSKINTWSTFSDTCVELDFSVENGLLICKAKIYDGSSFNGCREHLRFTAKIQLPKDFIDSMTDSIMWRFESFLQEAYETHLENKKNDWINKLRESILNK